MKGFYYIAASLHQCRTGCLTTCGTASALNASLDDRNAWYLCNKVRYMDAWYSGDHCVSRVREGSYANLGTWYHGLISAASSISRRFRYFAYYFPYLSTFGGVRIGFLRGGPWPLSPFTLHVLHVLPHGSKKCLPSSLFALSGLHTYQIHITFSEQGNT